MVGNSFKKVVMGKVFGFFVLKVEFMMKIVFEVFFLIVVVFGVCVFIGVVVSVVICRGMSLEMIF